MYAGLSADPRDYTNIKNHTFDAFKPKIDDEIIVTIDDVDDTGTNVVAGDILESKDGQAKFTRVAGGTGATSGHTAFKVEWVDTVDFPQAGIGVEKVKAIKAVCVQE